MRYDGRLGIVVFAVVIALAMASALYITPLSISDSDPSTYAIVVVLMLPLFALFVGKRRLDAAAGPLDIAAGLLALGLLAALTLFMRFEFSYLFVSYRLDMLLFPLFIAAEALMLFGRRNLRRFAPIAVYSALGSSLVMLPFIEANQGFAVLNTRLVYSIAKVFIHNIAYSAPVTIVANGYRLGVGQTCVGVGVLIGIVLFLLPIAYLYEGSLARKAAWVGSALALLFALNLARMAAITVAWIEYGPSSAIFEIHLVAGILLFYLSIIIAVLAAGRWGLRIGTGRKERGRSRSAAGRYYAAGIVLALVAALAYFALTQGYSKALDVSPLYLYTSAEPQLGGGAEALMAASLVNTAGLNASLIPQAGGISSIVAWGSGIGESEPLVVYIGYRKSGIASKIISGGRISGRFNFIDARGISGVVYLVESGGGNFFVYETAVPYIIPGEDASSVVSLDIVLPSGETLPVCPGYYVSGIYDTNILNPGFYNSTVRGDMTDAYCTLDRLVR